MALQQLEARLGAILEAKMDKKVEQVKDSLQETLTKLFQDMMIHKEEQPPQQDTITTSPAAKRGSDVGRRNHRGRPSSEDSETDDDSTLDSSTDSEFSDGTTTASKHKTFYFCVKKSALDVHGGYWPKVLHWYSADLSFSPSSYGGGGGAIIANNQLTTLKTMPPHGFNQGAGVVVLDSVIYFLGGSPVSYIGLELPNSSVPRTPDVFCFDTRYPHEGWKKASSMFAPRYNPAAYAVDGKIYALGGSYGGAKSFAEVYVPHLHGGLWKPLQIQRFSRRFSSSILIPVQADDYGRNLGKRRQLLVYNQSDATLCSFHFITGVWTVLDEHFGHYYYASFAAVGDFLYRYDDCEGGGGRFVYAYDLVRRKWFSEPVQGLQKKRNVFPPLSGYRPTFLFPVGNGDLCLAWYGFYRGTNLALNSMFCTVFAVDKPPYGDATIKSSYRIGYSNESDDCIHCFAV